MADFTFQRECRTTLSEVLAILEADDHVGSLDLHYTDNLVHATLCVSEVCTREIIQRLIQTIDEDLVDAIGIARDDFIVHVHQGRDLGVFSDHEFGENGDKGA